MKIQQPGHPHVLTQSTVSVIGVSHRKQQDKSQKRKLVNAEATLFTNHEQQGEVTSGFKPFGNSLCTAGSLEKANIMQSMHKHSQTHPTSSEHAETNSKAANICPKTCSSCSSPNIIIHDQKHAEIVTNSHEVISISSTSRKKVRTGQSLHKMLQPCK